jgi:transposase InsO family protein
MSKNDIISKVYYDTAGYGSIASTLADAKKVDSSITYQDVVNWKNNQVERKTNLRGHNSFVASHPLQEFQMDLAFFFDLNKEEKDYTYAGILLMEDIFTKYVEAVPVKSKQIPDVLEAIKKCLEKMGNKPESVYSDNEGAFVSNEVQKYFKENKINHITTLTHAPVAERMIRTIKSMIYPRVEKTHQKWYDVLYQVLLTYNHRYVNKVTKMTPIEARHPKNHLNVALNLSLNRTMERKYPTVKVGDWVKLYKKKDKLDKERTSVWSPNVYKVLEIIESHGQSMFKLSGLTKPVLRHEILLVN